MSSSRYFFIGLILSLSLLLTTYSAYSYVEIPLSGVDYSSWVDIGIVYGEGSHKAYYVRVIYDPYCFETGCGVGKPYRMWYGSSGGQVMLSESSNGITWSTPLAISSTNPSLGPKYHHVVIFDRNRFNEPDGPYYKIWFWTINQIYSINAIGYAESMDGVNWENVTTITQGSPQLVTGNSADWNYGSYGPVEVIYNPGGSPTLDLGNPLNNRYVMYFDGTNGREERIGLAISVDGINWVAYDADGDGGADPVLDCSQPWEYNSNGHCYVGYASIIKDSDGYHMLYSGGDRTNQGIGLAHSTDGIHWTKHPGNPLLHVTDTTSPPGYRSSRTYTPSVIYDGRFRMYYSAKSSSGDYAIGMALLINPQTSTTTVTDTETITTTVTTTKTKTKTSIREKTLTITETETITSTAKTTETQTFVTTHLQTLTETVISTSNIRIEVLRTVTEYFTRVYTTTTLIMATAYYTVIHNNTVTVEKEPPPTFFQPTQVSPAPLVLINIALLPAFLAYFRNRLPLSLHPGIKNPVRGRVRLTSYGLSFTKGILGERLYYLPRGSVLMWEKSTYVIGDKEHPAIKLTSVHGDYWIIYPKGIPTSHLDRIASWF